MPVISRRAVIKAAPAAIALAVVTLVSAAAVAVTYSLGYQPRWGDVPSWVAAIGTTAAVFVALGVAYSEYLSRKQRDHRRQADAVTAWVENPRGPNATGGTAAGPSEWVALLNTSGAVVYDVVVTLRFIVSGSEQPLPVYRFVRFLPPGRQFYTRCRSPLDDDGNDIATGIFENASLAFTDASGEHWVRDSTGVLHSLRESALADHGGRANVTFNWLTGKFPEG
ncbi:MAG: hypothetical protein PGN37_13500 [Mycobacterium kyogaense]|uniref:hypothetical protein n=1 Tax=Mycobacterium kyogaense TaxID=2212479 RepID=UPI002FF924FD